MKRLAKRPTLRMPPRKLPELKLMSFRIRRLTAGLSAVSSRTTNKSKAHEGGDGKIPYHVRGEPVLLVALLQHDLERPEPDGHEEQTREIDLPLFPDEVGRVFDEAHDQEHVEDAHRDIDIEYPGPGVVVGEPSAEGRPEGRPEDDAETVDAHGRCLFFHGERLSQHRLRQGYEGTAADALENAEDDHRRQVPGDPAEHGRAREDRDGKKVKPFAPEPGAQERDNGHDDDAGEDVARRDPGDLLDRGAEGAAHVGQGHVHYAYVESGHEGPRHHRDRDEPFIMGFIDAVHRAYRLDRGEPVFRLTSTVGVTESPGHKRMVGVERGVHDDLYGEPLDDLHEITR